MEARTAVDFYRAHWLSLTLIAGVMSVYFVSALVNGDYLHALTGVAFIVLVVAILWRRHDHGSA